MTSRRIEKKVGQPPDGDDISAIAEPDKQLPVWVRIPKLRRLVVNEQGRTGCSEGTAAARVISRLELREGERHYLFSNIVPRSEVLRAREYQPNRLERALAKLSVLTAAWISPSVAMTTRNVVIRGISDDEAEFCVEWLKLAGYSARQVRVGDGGVAFYVSLGAEGAD